METTTIKGTVKVPKVTAENMASDKSICDAINSETQSTLAAGEAGIRSYGFLASVVALTEYRQVDIVEKFGAKKSNLSKAKTCLDVVLTGIISPEETATYSHYQDAIEFIVMGWDSLDTAHKELVLKHEKKELTLVDAVSNLFKLADKNGWAREDVLKEVTKQK